MNIKNLIKYNFIGSRYFISLLTNKYLISEINKINNNGSCYHLFFHNWKIKKFKNIFFQKILHKNFLCHPYIINVIIKFPDLILRVNFSSVKNYFK